MMNSGIRRKAFQNRGFKIEEVPEVGCDEVLQYFMSFERRSNLMQDLELAVLID